jgi:hypothetical protein
MDKLASSTSGYWEDMMVDIVLRMLCSFSVGGGNQGFTVWQEWYAGCEYRRRELREDYLRTSPL